jgi:hypothetical protein
VSADSADAAAHHRDVIRCDRAPVDCQYEKFDWKRGGKKSVFGQAGQGLYENQILHDRLHNSPTALTFAENFLLKHYFF